MKNIHFEITDDLIAIITIDCPGSKVNKVSGALLEEISVMMDELTEKKIRGIAILSGKEDNFIVGADIDELKNMKTEEAIRNYITRAHAILNSLASLPVPKVCAIQGNCLGGGLELALAADYRIAADSTMTVFGLPEVMIGLLPAAGGTHRLPRVIGLRNAMPFLLTGKNLRVKKAKRLGLIDEVVPMYMLKDAALLNVRDMASGKKKRKRKRSLIDVFLESTAMGRNIVFKKARSMVMRQTQGLYPAPLSIIDSVADGYRRGVASGMNADIERFVKLVISPQAKSLMTLFFAMNDRKKNPMEKNARPVSKIAVIGTGLMGSGIASVSTSFCDTILMKDVTIDAAARGMKEIWKGLAKQKESGALLPFERDLRYGKLVPCDNYIRFKKTDIVIEAVFEDINLKRRILREVEDATDSKTIFASNTSALPIGSIAEGCRRPENVIGMHYFSPVPKMPLLEIIVTKKTASWVAATALDLGVRQGKTCILVKDGPGFYTTRILAPLLFEAAFLITEGAALHDIDRAMLRFGYPVGPVQLLDEVGIDVGVHVIKELSGIFEKRGIPQRDNLSIMLDKKFLGRKSGIGMYRYDIPKKKGQREVNEEVYRIFSTVPRRAFDETEIQSRISLMMVNEAVFCLQEGVINAPEVGDIGAILGLGFPPFLGGPFRYIDSCGAAGIVNKMKELAEKHGKRFSPAPLLEDMAKKNKKFYK